MAFWSGAYKKKLVHPLFVEWIYARCEVIVVMNVWR
jgi:hypothetical protein